MGIPHVAGLQTTFVPENWSGTITVESGIDGNVINAGVERYRKLNSQHLSPAETGFPDPDSMLVVVETVQSKVRVAIAARTTARLDGETLELDRTNIEDRGFVAQQFTFEAEAGAPTTVDKIADLRTSRDRALAEPGRAARVWVMRHPSFDELLRSHTLSWDLTWRRFRLKTGAADFEAMVLNLHSFHLIQTVSKHSIDLDIYFTKPFASWQKGTNENTNGLLRQFFPKGTDFTQVSHRDVARVEQLLNERPRRRLGYRTPAEAIAKHLCRN